MLEASSAFTTTALNVTRFETQFTFQILNTTDPSSDGFTFCIQTAGATALGAPGGELGYGPGQSGSPNGIPHSVAIKFDLYSNEGEGFDSTGLYTGGVDPTLPGSIDLGGTGIDLHSQDLFNVAMTYNGATLGVTMTDTLTGALATQSYAVNIPRVVGSNTAYVGFTAGTGDLTSQQSILTWTYTPISVSPPAAPSNLTVTATSPTQNALSWTANSSNQAAFLIERRAGTSGIYNLIAQTSPSATTFVDSGLNPKTEYFYRMRAIDAAGVSAYSNQAVPGLNFSSGFAGSTSLLTFNGPAKLNGAALELTDGGMAEAASAFSDNKLAVIGFSTQFTFQILNTTNPSADGFTFCIQNAGVTALGQNGGGLGYGADSTGQSGGIPNSVAVKFDLFDNQGEGNDSTGLYTDGAAPTNVGSIDLTSTGINLHSQHVFNVAMTYDGAVLKVTITDTVTHASASQSYTINIPATVGGNTAYVGFTAGTGGLTAKQSILNWTYSPLATLGAPANVSALVTAPIRTGITGTTFRDTSLAAATSYHQVVDSSDEGIKSIQASTTTIRAASAQLTAAAGLVHSGSESPALAVHANTAQALWRRRFLQLAALVDRRHPTPPDAAKAPTHGE